MPQPYFDSLSTKYGLTIWKQGMTYVGGGVLAMVPVDMMRSMCADIVISVDVGYCGGLRPSLKSISIPSIRSNGRPCTTD